MEQEIPTTGTKIITLRAPDYMGATMPTKESPKTAEPLREPPRELPPEPTKAKMEKTNNLTTTLGEKNPKTEDHNTCTRPWVDKNATKKRTQMDVQYPPALDMAPASTPEGKEIHESHRSLYPKTNMNSSTKERAWQTYGTTAQTLETTTEPKKTYAKIRKK